MLEAIGFRIDDDDAGSSNRHDFWLSNLERFAMGETNRKKSSNGCCRSNLVRISRMVLFHPLHPLQSNRSVYNVRGRLPIGCRQFGPFPGDVLELSPRSERAVNDRLFRSYGLVLVSQDRCSVGTTRWAGELRWLSWKRPTLLIQRWELGLATWRWVRSSAGGTGQRYLTDIDDVSKFTTFPERGLANIQGGKE